MRILKKIIQLGGEGFLHIIPEHEEDLFYVYNLLMVGDAVRAKTSRKVIRETKTGTVQTEKKLINLTLTVCSVNYTAESEIISIKGRNLEENEYLSFGQYHTLKVELNQPLKISKKCWERHHLDLLRECTDVTVSADVAAMVMDEGVAHLCYVKNNITTIKAKVEKNIPKKKSGSEFHSKALKDFYDLCFQRIINVDFSKIKCFIIASPGFIKDEFYEYIKEMSKKEEYTKRLKGHLEKFLLIKSSNGYKDALSEVLIDQTVMKIMGDTKAIKEVRMLEKFFQTMKSDPDKITYGPKHVSVFLCMLKKLIKLT
jgi:protein pelota